jgi:hypothetical protein
VARKSAGGGLILHRYMRKGKRPPTPPTKCHKICVFWPFHHMARKLATLQPSIPSPGVEISQAHLDGWSQAPKPESGHLGRPSPPPLLFNFLCTYTYSAWVSFKNNICFCPCFLGFHCIPSLGYNFPSI